MLRRYGWLALALLLIGASSLRAPVEYSGSGLRDPFEEVGGVNVAASEGEPVVTGRENAMAPANSAVLEGLLWNSRSPHAIISGQVVQVGSRVGQAQVVRIDKNGVILSYNGREQLLSRKGSLSNETK